MNSPTLETRRLVLRRFTEKDVPALFALLSDREVNTFLPMFPLETPEETHAYLQEHYLEPYRRPAGFRYAICLKTHNVPIGFVKLSGGEAGDFGYGLQKAFWHQGIVTEACTAVVRKIREAGVPFITATHDVNNPFSGRVMRKIGMTYRYSYEELWQPKNFTVVFRMYQLNFDGQDDRVYRGYWNRYPNHFVEAL